MALEYYSLDEGGLTYALNHLKIIVAEHSRSLFLCLPPSPMHVCENLLRACTWDKAPSILRRRLLPVRRAVFIQWADGKGVRHPMGGFVRRLGDGLPTFRWPKPVM